MGAKELEREYKQLTGMNPKPASPSRGLPGPIWALSHWLLADRDGISLFATGLSTALISGIIWMLARAGLNSAFFGTESSLFVFAMLAVYIGSAIFAIMGALTILASAIRIGTNADHKIPPAS